MMEDWHAIVQMFADKYVDVKSILIDVVKGFPVNDNEFHKGHVSCICAFSIDLCLLMLNRKRHVNISSVMSCLVEAMFCKNPNACCDFLKCLSV